MARPLATEQTTRYREAQAIRNPRENDYRMAAAYCLPRHYNAWSLDGPANYGQSAVAATRRIAYDSTGVRALPKYAAILERMATPHNMKWHGLTVGDRKLAQRPRVRLFFDELRDELFRMRYEARSQFKQAMSEVNLSLGTYGTGPVYYGQRGVSPLNRTPGFLYKACPLRDIFILVNDEGEVDTVFRRFWLNYRQFQQKFPNVKMPKTMAAKSANGVSPKENDYVEFFHVVHTRTDYDPQALDSRRHPIVGSYVCVPDQEYVGEEEGFRSMPYLTPRTFTEAGDPYGFAPAMQALPALGTASAMKKTAIKQGQKAVDPVILAHDDGVLNGVVDLRPGHVNMGGVDKQGRKLIQTLESGNFNVSEKLLEQEREDINDSFFVTLFQILTETPEMTATEVMERVAERSSLLSPTMGRLQSELLGPGIMREIDMLDEMGRMPKIPPELIEAGAQYDIVYTSPMAKGMYAEEVSGFMRAVEMAMNVAERTQDPSQLDHFNFDVAIPEMSDYMAVPARWMNEPKVKQAMRDGRAKAAQEAELMKNAAPLAGAFKTAASMQEGAQ
ncbi:hypothetical protein EKK58_09260 [Candidatus Dependentiae bacterium]|nr:MAG: hypothetical protein EKK58_09260 [Candidatus Dependentiae bacterium]